MSFESPLGSLGDPNLKCTCCEDLASRPGLPTYGQDLGAVDQRFLKICREQTTNLKGHSYLSHFLCFGVGGYIYKRHPYVVDALLAELLASLRKLFFEGVRTKRGIFYAAILGIKGDLDFHKKAMNLLRSYANIGTVNKKELCHLCMAGGDGVAAEDFGENPGWLQTMYDHRPWSTETPPILAGIPFDAQFPEEVLKLDVFHVHRLGVGRDVIGGVLIVLMRLKFFDYPGSTLNLDDRFARAHGKFALWCLAEKVSPGLRSFTKSFFNMTNLLSALWASSKGSDTLILLKWLRFLLTVEINCPTVQGHGILLGQMLQVIEAALGLQMLNYHGLWLERSCARALYISVMTLLRGYSVLARAAINLQIRAFLIKPKHHSLHHLAMALKLELQKGATLIFSPQSACCSMNEDYIGRISRLSRRVGFKHCDLRVIHRYFMKFSILLKRRVDPETGLVRKQWAKRWKVWGKKKA
eukprot:Skav219830  [mRNA]  locus=scaffold1238:601373:602779:+ [translate_table: standard]